MTWLIQTYADVYEVLLGRSDVYGTSVKCDKHLRSRERTHRQRRAC